MSEITDEHIEHLKHQDFKNKNHEGGCTCGYCEMKRWEKQQQQLRKEFNKRIKVLGKIEGEVKEELFLKFVSCYDAGFNCFYCGNEMELKWGSELSFTWDHTIPRKVGGKNTTENIELVCRTCNFLKGEKNASWFVDNVKRLKLRKKKNEYWKARKATIKDEQTRESYKEIFKIVGVKKE